MKHILKVHYDKKPIYDIVINPDYQGLSQALNTLDIKNRKVMIITDSNVASYHLEKCIEQFKSEIGTVYSHIIPAGECNKNLDTVATCYEQLILHGFDRKDILVALGGGVVGDLTGFVAATYLRGISFIQVPTTLLSTVDSSIGGKTGVDFNAYKNMVGAFHQPKLVYINIGLLNTLPEDEYLSGMGEIIKHGLIKDLDYYEWLKNNRLAIQTRDMDVVAEMIYRSCDIKRAVVEEDPTEQGVRALLNFGHTIGHAIEKLMNFKLLHGDCVALGMIAASYLTLKRGLISETDYEDIVETIDSFHRLGSIKELKPEEVHRVSTLDKKMDGAIIKFILLKDKGEAYIDLQVTKEDIIEAVEVLQQR